MHHFPVDCRVRAHSSYTAIRDNFMASIPLQASDNMGKKMFGLMASEIIDPKALGTVTVPVCKAALVSDTTKYCIFLR